MMTVDKAGQIEKVDWSVVVDSIQGSVLSDVSTDAAARTVDESEPIDSDEGTLIVNAAEDEKEERCDVMGNSDLSVDVRLSVSLPSSIPSDVENIEGEITSLTEAESSVRIDDHAALDPTVANGKDMSFLMVLQGISGVAADAATNASANISEIGGINSISDNKSTIEESRELQLTSSNNQPQSQEQHANANVALLNSESDETKSNFASLQNGSAVQIVSVGSGSDDTFNFHEFEFESILAKIPEDSKIGVLSVLGAFRTGKSFLMSWFLKYLEEASRSTTCSQEGRGEGFKWFDTVEKLNNDEGSFPWRGGEERNTLGMYLWSEPFFLAREDGSKMALLLVDTQGMNDNETAGGIQASIFGLSVLMSSYQIYNVNFQIQDDHLQQLAFFTEYGRVAVGHHHRRDDHDDDGDSTALSRKPFQRVDFLIRNFQHFDLYVGEEDEIPEVEIQMNHYLERVMGHRENSGLQESRDQIASCFTDVSCFMLPFPGSSMTRARYDGKISRIDPSFLLLLDRYCRKVFGSNPDSIQPKMINGREVTAGYYKQFVKAYAKSFQSFGSTFPEAQTILLATSNTHNSRVVAESVQKYKSSMSELMAQHSNGCCLPRTLKQQHLSSKERAMRHFRRMATFGTSQAIIDSRQFLLSEIELVYNGYWHANMRQLLARIAAASATFVGTVALLAIGGRRR